MKKVEQKDIEQIEELLKKVLDADGYLRLERMGGLTNRTYHVTLVDGAEYVVRIAGEGTEELINRSHERASTTLACELGIDAELLYFGEDGLKVTRYIPNAVTMSAESLHEETHIRQMAEIFQTLHQCGKDTSVPFDVFEMAAGYEKIIQNLKVPMYDDYQECKQKVMDIKSQIDSVMDITLVPCHNDALCENWVEGDGRMFLIDWEYAGMNDGMWDLSDVSLEAGFDQLHDKMFLQAYLNREPDVLDHKHFLANKIYVDYLWTLWAKARVPYDGQPMEDWATERYERLKENICKFDTIKEEL